MKKTLLGFCLLSLPLFSSMAEEPVSTQFVQADGKWQYTQDFNSLIDASVAFNSVSYTPAAFWKRNITLPGWFLSRGGYMNTESFRVDNGGAYTAAAFYSYGYLNASTKPNVGKTDAECLNRSLGSVVNANSSTATQYIGVLLKNNTGATITKLDISYTGHLWKGPNYVEVETSRVEKLEFSYTVNPIINLSGTDINNKDINDTLVTGGILVPALDFIRPVGNDAYGIKGFGKMDGMASKNMASISGSIDVNIPVGQTVLLRWKDYTLDAALSHNYGKSIDDFSVTATTESTGVKNALASDIQVYNENSNIIVKSNGNVNISVYALDGRSIVSVQASSKTTTIPNMKIGNVYIVKVGSETFKVAL